MGGPASLTCTPAETLSATPGVRRGVQDDVGFLRKHWRGEYSLPRSYWVNTFLITMFAPAIALVLSYLVAERPARYSSAAVLFVTALGHVAWFWAVRGTWMSANRHRRAGGAWGWLAKTVIVLGAIRAVFEFVGARHGLTEHWATLLGKQAGPAYTLRLSADGRSLSIEGGMNDGAADALSRELRATPTIHTVLLDSGGGWTREGALVANVIKQHKLATRVDGECSSACTLAFLAGRERTLGSRGRIGFHQVRTIGNAGYLRALDLGKTRAMYNGSDLPAAFMDKVVATPPDELWYPTIGELRAAHVVTEFTEWNEARKTLSDTLRVTLQKSLGEVRISARATDRLLECEVTERIKWLNTTDCSFLFDKNTTSREAHLAEQDKCLAKAGLTEVASKISLACSKAHLPNDWAIFSSMFATQFAKTFTSAGVDSERAPIMGRCVATGYIDELNRTWCSPINQDATSAEELFGMACIDKQGAALERRVDALVKDCGMRVERLGAGSGGRARYASLR